MQFNEPEPAFDREAFEAIVRSAPVEGLAQIPEDLAPMLEQAHARYLAAADVCDGDVPEPTKLEDRARHADLFRVTPEGTPSLSDEDAVEFMHRVTQLSRALCATWVYMDWVETVASGIIEADSRELIAEAYSAAVQIACADC